MLGVLRECKETMESTRLFVVVEVVDCSELLERTRLDSVKRDVLPVTSAMCRGFQSSRLSLSRESMLVLLFDYLENQCVMVRWHRQAGWRERERGG